MLTGKSRMLRVRRELLVKKRNGTVIPVSIYLFLNSMNRKQMVIVFEENLGF